MMVLYNPLGIKEFPEMMKLWQKLAIENGLPGICFIHQQNQYDHSKEYGGELFDYGIEFQMNRAVIEFTKKSILFNLERVLNRIADKIPFLRCKFTTMQYTYDQIWNIILNTEPKDDKWLPGAFVDWDNTPRRKNRGQVCTGVTPEKFKK